MSHQQEIWHGCRSEYGPLELRVEPTASSNGFKIYVEDLRLEAAMVCEQMVHGELESAQDSVALRAHEYLSRDGEVPIEKTKWRCS
ncbi:MAG: hypothetical protein ABL995_14325 [Bryobacteraceae bacterium]